jgi:hypothetical protein
LSGKRPEGIIRKAADLPGATLTTYLENSRGTTKTESYSTIRKRLKRGDYLRILGEAKNGELHESILRLV